MGFLDIFRRRRPIRELAQLAEFIDEQAAFLVQKGIFEYARARSGHYSKVLFNEPSFIEASDRSRWQAYPLGLAMLAELAEGVLGAAVGGDRGQRIEMIRRLTLSVFDTYPRPDVLEIHQWRDARAELDRRLQLIGLHPPKRSFEIADPFARAYFDLFPIHESLRRSEFQTVHGYLRIMLCNMHEDLRRRIDAQQLREALSATSGTMFTAAARP